jgi:hypothetical protein
MASDAILTFSNRARPVSFWGRDGTEILFHAILIGALLALAFFTPHHGARWFAKVERFLARFGQRQWAIVTVGLLSLSVAIGLTVVAGVPVPKVDDEFSYLLAADTFAHGRLTNPSHPLWVHFETFHTIQQPTYASRYPPGQGLILALGQIIGHPVIGVWLSTAFASAAVYWMLMGWLPRRWAVIGALLAMIHPEILIWSQRYWGGNLTLAGGALGLGGFRRLLGAPVHYDGLDRSDAADRPAVRDALIMSIGMAILIICRPYEGGVLILILLAALGIPLITHNTGSILTNTARIGSPVALCLVATGVWMCYYNWRVTQDPFRMPHQVYIATYNAAPVFLWQKPPAPPAYRHKQMRDFHMGWELQGYKKQQGLKELTKGLIERLLKLLRSDLRLWPVVPAFLALPWVMTNRWMQVALLIWLLFTAALLQVTWTFFHYAAPAFGLFFIIAVQCLRHLRLWFWRGKPVGLFLMRGCLILSVLSLPYSFWNIAQQNRYARRQKVIARLQQEGGTHLIIVRYAADVSNPVEWVYNEADIDHAQIVWARETDTTGDHDLTNYFKDRHVWLLQVDKGQTRLLPYVFSANS